MRSSNAQELPELEPDYVYDPKDRSEEAQWAVVYFSFEDLGADCLDGADDYVWAIEEAMRAER